MLVAAIVQPAVVVGGDLSTALLIVGAVILGVMMLPFLLSWIEPPKTQQPRHVNRDARAVRRIR